MTIQHTTRKHARLSASRAERFINCPGSVRLEAQMPNEPAGEAAAIGTAIHELSEAMLRGDDLIQADYPDDHWDMASDYVKFVNELCEKPKLKRIEVNVDDGLKQLHPALGGTADAVLAEGNTLHVIDLKTGRVPVEAENNLQLMTYALGAMRKFNAPAGIDVVLHIFQPRTGHSQWQTNGHALIAHGKRLQHAAELASSDNAPTNPGDAQCKYCRAKSICPSLREKVINAAKKEFDIDSTPITTDMIEDAKLAETWASAVLDHAKQILDSGTEIKGWTLKPGRKTKFWRDEELTNEFFRSNQDAWELKSPAALIKAKIAIPEQLLGEKQSAPSLVRAK